jgi:hypothetical protein
MRLRAFLALSALAVTAAGCAARPVVARAPSGVGVTEEQSPAPAPTTTAPAPLTPEAEAPPTATPPSAKASPSTTDSDRGRRDPHVMRRFAGWAILSVGVEAAIVAVASSAMIQHQRNIRDSNCNAQKLCNQTGKNAADTIDSMVGWNTASWVTAIAGVAVGVTLVVISPPGKSNEAAVTVDPNPGGAGLNLRGTF